MPESVPSFFYITGHFFRLHLFLDGLQLFLVVSLEAVRHQVQGDDVRNDDGFIVDFLLQVGHFFDQYLLLLRVFHEILFEVRRLKHFFLEVVLLEHLDFVVA